MSIEAYKDSYDFVSETLAKEPSIDQMSSYEEFASKTLLIAAAGQHEREITKLLKEMPAVHKSPGFIMHFLANQALNRKYHTLFNWKAKNINSFAGLFGDEMKQRIIELCGDQQCTKDFLFIGNERNRIVHNGLATESLEQTFPEIWNKYLSSCEFITLLRKALH